WSASVSGGTLPASNDSNKITGIYKLPSSIRDNGGQIIITLRTTDPKGDCTSAEDTMIITVLKKAVITPPENSIKNQTLCKDTQLQPIIFNIGEAGTGSTASDLPPGVTGTFADGKFT